MGYGRVPSLAGIPGTMELDREGTQDAVRMGKKGCWVELALMGLSLYI